MRNIIKLFETMRSIAIIALATVIGFSFAGCDDGNNGNNNNNNGGAVPGFAGTYTGTSFEFSSSQGYVGSMDESDYLSGNASDITLTVVSDTNVSTNNAGGLFKLYGGGKYYGVQWVNKTTGEFAFTSKPISGSGSFELYKPDPPNHTTPINTTFGGFYNSAAGTITINLTYWEQSSAYTTGKLVLTKQPAP